MKSMTFLKNSPYITKGSKTVSYSGYIILQRKNLQDCEFERIQRIIAYMDQVKTSTLGDLVDHIIIRKGKEKNIKQSYAIRIDVWKLVSAGILNIKQVGTKKKWQARIVGVAENFSEIIKRTIETQKSEYF